MGKKPRGVAPHVVLLRIQTVSGSHERTVGCQMQNQPELIPELFRETAARRRFQFKKRNGYSELEIAQKREALENILIPYHLAENTKLLLESGFSSCEMFFRWYNFCGIVAVK